MTYDIRESDLSDYYRNGYVIFRQILPAPLIADLRREADKAVVIARQLRDANAQRLQPLQAHADKLDLKPFRDYAELPALNQAVRSVLSPEHCYGRLDVLGILLNPGESAYSTTWHRDMKLASSRLSAEEFQDLMLDWNSAKPPGPVVQGRSVTSFTDPVERERACWNYTAAMPGAVQLRLNPGDFAMYRPIGWHIGNYVPYKKRATLHDVVWTPAYEKWWRAWRNGSSPRWERNPREQSKTSSKAGGL